MNDTTRPEHEEGAAAPPRALAVRNPELPDDVIEALVTAGDVSALTPAQRVTYYRHRCRSLGLDAASQPFQYLRLQGRLILYASKSCAQSLAARDGLSFQVVGYQQIGDVYVVQGRITDGKRSTDDLGAVPIQGLRGEHLANALMKARTKAHRRCVLSHCGLGELDESEVETIAGAERIAPAAAHVEPIPAAVAVPPPAPVAPAAPAGPASLAKVRAAAFARMKGMAPDAAKILCERVTGKASRADCTLADWQAVHAALDEAEAADRAARGAERQADPADLHGDPDDEAAAAAWDRS